MGDEPPQAYLAGPEVFLEDALEIGEAKKAICARYGIAGLFPFEPADTRSAPGISRGEVARRHFESCIRLMDAAQLMIANLTPFRGVSMDVGTAVELGYMFASGRPVFGYTNVADDYEQRVADDGLVVERFGLADNLMCEGPIRASGGTLIRGAAPPDRRLRDLDAFEACVEQAVRILGLVG